MSPKPLPKLKVRASVQAGEAGHRGQSFRLQVGPALADSDAEIRGDALCKIDIDADLLRTVGIARRAGDRRQRHLVGDERVVGQDRRREEALAGKAMSHRVSRRRHHSQRDSRRAGKKPRMYHWNFSAIREPGRPRRAIGADSRQHDALGRS